MALLTFYRIRHALGDSAHISVIRQVKDGNINSHSNET